jgi:phage terminase large subunit-like protein
MVRTQVYLTDEQARDIKVRAQRERRREADIIRDLLERGRLTSTGKRQETTGEALMRLVSLGKELGLSGPTDLSTNHDDYLYGDKE